MARMILILPLMLSSVTSSTSDGAGVADGVGAAGVADGVDHTDGVDPSNESTATSSTVPRSAHSANAMGTMPAAGGGEGERCHGEARDEEGEASCTSHVGAGEARGAGAAGAAHDSAAAKVEAEDGEDGEQGLSGGVVEEEEEEEEEAGAEDGDDEPPMHIPATRYPVYNRHIFGQGFMPTEYQLSAEECEEIIDDVESFVEYNNKGVWETQRHEAYPTTDLDVFQTMDSIRAHALYEKVAPLLTAIRRLYSIPPSIDVVLEDFFVAKYEHNDQTGAQRQLLRHFDGVLLSFVVALCEEDAYEGGNFTLGSLMPGGQKQSLKVPRGRAVVFPGGLLQHRVEPVTEGIRYMLTGFVELKHPQHVSNMLIESWSTRWKDTVSAKDEKREMVELVGALRMIPFELERLSTKLVARNPGLSDAGGLAEGA